MPILVELPDHLKDVADALQELAKVVEGRRQSGGDGRAVDYAAIEDELAEVAARIERGAHRACLESLDINVPAVLVDGIRYSRAGRAPGTYYTLAGPVQVERTLYRRRGEPTFDTISRRVGAVADGWLPRTARAMAHEVQKSTSREAETTARELKRLPYSRSSFERVAHAVGEHYVARQHDIEEALIQQYEVPSEAISISVSLDRVSVPMEEPRQRPRGRPRKGTPRRPVVCAYRMAYCGTLTLHDQEGRAIHTLRYGRMPAQDAELLVQGMAADVRELLDKVPTLQVVLLCDGAPEMWNLLDPVFTGQLLGRKPRRHLDYHHVIEKLAPAARALSNDSRTLLERWKLRLLNQKDAASAILEELKSSGLEEPRGSEDRSVHDALTYLENHADRLDYATPRRQGLPIGSGNVEATCKSLFAVRLKRAGCRWKTETGEHIVRLRAAALSDWWDEALTLTLAPLRKSVRRAA